MYNYENVQKEKRKEYLKSCQELETEVNQKLMSLLKTLERITQNAVITSTRLTKDATAMEASCKMLSKQTRKIKLNLEEILFDFRQGNLSVAGQILEELRKTNTWILHVAVNFELIASKNAEKSKALVLEDARKLKEVKEKADSIIIEIEKKIEAVREQDNENSTKSHS